MMTDWDAARRLLEGDRVWCAYALADLDSHLRGFSDVWMNQNSLLLRYRGLSPAVLFTYGDPGAIRMMIPAVEPDRYTFTFDLPTRTGLDDLLCVEHETEMDRMYYKGPKRASEKEGGARSLTGSDVDAIRELIAEHSDQPDAFDPSQLEYGSFFGVWRESRLIAIAGTHVLSPTMSVAAVGNVFTHPSQRGKGYGRIASSAVLNSLIDQGIQTIVLNTQIQNKAALHLYHSLGFESYCHYMEGVALIPA